MKKLVKCIVQCGHCGSDCEVTHTATGVEVLPFKKQDLSKLKQIVTDMENGVIGNLSMLILNVPGFKEFWVVVKEVLKDVDRVSQT